MNRKEKQVTIRGVEFTVREIRLGDMLPLMKRFGGDDNAEAQLEMVKKAVYVNGEQVGDALDEYGFGIYGELVQAVLEVNGMTGDDEGKD